MGREGMREGHGGDARGARRVEGEAEGRRPLRCSPGPPSLYPIEF